MNQEPLKPRRKLSQFFYENILFDYVTKDLSEDDHQLMKELTSKGVDNKKHLGSVLLALEYLSKIQSVELSVSPAERPSSLVEFFMKQRYKFLFIFLTSIFIGSGYYLITNFM